MCSPARVWRAGLVTYVTRTSMNARVASARTVGHAPTHLATTHAPVLSTL